MEISPYVVSLREDLLSALKAVAPDLGDLSPRLGSALDPALRLSLMEVLSDAAAEITRELPAGSVEVRLNGREPELVVDLPETPDAVPGFAEPDFAGEEEDSENLARITLRIPENVKARIEELASKSGASVNSWVVNALRQATREDGFTINLGDWGFGRGGHRGQRMNGWM